MDGLVSNMLFMVAIMLIYNLIFKIISTSKIIKKNIKVKINIIIFETIRGIALIMGQNAVFLGGKADQVDPQSPLTQKGRVRNRSSKNKSSL